jgi:hypothetical protein
MNNLHEKIEKDSTSQLASATPILAKPVRLAFPRPLENNRLLSLSLTHFLTAATLCTWFERALFASNAIIINVVGRPLEYLDGNIGGCQDFFQAVVEVFVF